MRLEKRKAAFLIVLVGLALEAAVALGPAAAEEIKRLEEHAGVQIFRGLDRDAEFQEPLLSRQPRPIPDQPEKEETREEQREPPEVRTKVSQAPTGSAVSNAAASTVPCKRSTRPSSAASKVFHASSRMAAMSLSGPPLSTARSAKSWTS